jgi:hypothetical protein
MPQPSSTEGPVKGVGQLASQRATAGVKPHDIGRIPGVYAAQGQAGRGGQYNNIIHFNDL